MLLVKMAVWLKLVWLCLSSLVKICTGVHCSKKVLANMTVFKHPRPPSFPYGQYTISSLLISNCTPSGSRLLFFKKAAKFAHLAENSPFYSTVTDFNSDKIAVTQCGCGTNRFFSKSPLLIRDLIVCSVLPQVYLPLICSYHAWF